MSDIFNILESLNMKILYINHYAGSLKHGMEFRPFYLSREWVQDGHEVTILASSESHVRAQRPVTSGVFTEELIEGVRYIWCQTPSYKVNGIKRFINMLTFIMRVFQYSFSLKKLEKPQIVIASSTYPLDIFPSWWIARTTKAKLLFEVHDLWPLSPMELGGMSKFHPFIFLMQFAENFAYRYSDTVVSMLPKTMEHMTSHGMKPEKFIYIPNGIDLQEWLSAPPVASQKVLDLMDEIKADQSKGNFTIAYLGTHGLANALDNFIKAAEILKSQSIIFYLVGHGPDKDQLINLAKSKGLTNVKFFAPIPKDTIPQVTRLFDANYIGLQRQSLFRFGISPNKLMDYMAAGKPIISAIEAGNDPVGEARCGISVQAENPEALAKGILKLKEMSQDERKALGQNGYEFLCKEHNYKNLAKKFTKAMEQ